MSSVKVSITVLRAIFLYRPVLGRYKLKSGKSYLSDHLFLSEFWESLSYILFVFAFPGGKSDVDDFKNQPSRVEMSPTFLERQCQIAIILTKNR